MDARRMSERRACKAIGFCRMTINRTRADDAALRQRMRAIAEVRRRFGYRRLPVLLKPEGNHKKLFRLYREERLAVRRRRPQAGYRDPGTDDGADRVERALVRDLALRAMPKAPRQLPSLSPPDQANPTGGANSGWIKLGSKVKMVATSGWKIVGFSLASNMFCDIALALR
jgi:hypothetical protein